MSNSLTADIQEILLPSAAGRTLYITLGNDMRGDDGIGPYIGSQCPPLSENQSMINAGEHPENIIDEVIKMAPSKIVFIDAADFGQAPGTIASIPLEALPEHTLSTHRFPIAVLANLIMQDCQAEVIFIGIQLAQVNFNAPLTPMVLRAGQDILASIQKGEQGHAS